MSVSTPWTNSTPASTARNNKVTVISDTGTNLNALDISKHRVVFCTADGGPFLKDHTYTANADEDEWIDITAISAHSHGSDTDGGEFIDTLIANPEVIDLWLIKTNDMQKANWIETVTGTGTIEDHTDANSIRAIKLRPNATSGSGATIRYPSPLNLNFSSNSICVFTTQFDTNATSLAFHGGINADDVTAADSNTVKYNAEVCTATNSNWWLRSASGSATSASDTGQAISTSRISVRLIHWPDLGTPEVNISISASTLFQKTTNVPTTGNSTTNNLFKVSQKNSTGADRAVKFYGARISYITNGAWGYGI